MMFCDDTAHPREQSETLHQPQKVAVVAGGNIFYSLVLSLVLVNHSFTDSSSSQWPMAR